MRFLIDAQLPPALAAWRDSLADLGSAKLSSRVQQVLVVPRGTASRPRGLAVLPARLVASAFEPFSRLRQQA